MTEGGTQVQGTKVIDSAASDKSGAATILESIAPGFVKDAAIPGTKLRVGLPGSEERRIYQREWRRRNPARVREYQITSNSKRADDHKAYTREWTKTDRAKELKRLWRQSPKGQAFLQARRRSPVQQIYNLLHRILRKTNSPKVSRAYKMLGYTAAQLRERVESQFRDGMTWYNAGEVWQLDHIKEVVTFLADGVTDPAVINALDNLQPLLIGEHRAKTAAFLARRVA